MRRDEVNHWANISYVPGFTCVWPLDLWSHLVKSKQFSVTTVFQAYWLDKVKGITMWPSYFHVLVWPTYRMCFTQFPLLTSIPTYLFSDFFKRLTSLK